MTDQSIINAIDLLERRGFCVFSKKELITLDAETSFPLENIRPLKRMKAIDRACIDWAARSVFSALLHELEKQLYPCAGVSSEDDGGTFTRKFRITLRCVAPRGPLFIDEFIRAPFSNESKSEK